MSENTLVGNIRSRLIAQTWTGSSNVVFPTGSVAVVPTLVEGFRTALEMGFRTPFVLIAPVSAESDPEFDEEPNWIRFMVDILFAVLVPGDGIGENAMLGANKTGGSTQSEGRGILELEPEVYNAIGKLNPLESVTLQIRQRGEQGGSSDGRGNYIAYRVLTFETFGSAT